MISVDEIRKRRREILRIAARHGARKVRLFGSVVRGEATEKSDVDVLVKLDDDRSLVDHVALMRELEELLGCSVDVVSEDALDRAIRERVLKEGVSL